MELFAAIKNSFEQLNDVLNHLTEEQYISPSENLSHATIGQHMRHIIELYQCLLNGYEDEVVCYDNRKRDAAIEMSKELAKQLLTDILSSADRENKEMKLESWHGGVNPSVLILPTNYYRELMYNMEHTVHHMALIRVGINEVSTINIPEGFGVATSTIKYRKSCAQ